jgi:hypothetical protein
MCSPWSGRAEYMLRCSTLVPFNLYRTLPYPIVPARVRELLARSLFGPLWNLRRCGSYSQGALRERDIT